MLDRLPDIETAVGDPVLDLLTRVGAVYTEGHFVYTSGKHGPTYVNKDAMYQHPLETTLVCRMFAERYQFENIDVVVGPAMGGIILAQWTAYHLSKLKGKEVLGVFTEKENDKQVLRRGYGVQVRGKNILIVEDIVNTGKTIGEVIDSVNKAGGKIVAVTAMVNRNSEKTNSLALGLSFSALCTIEAEAFNEKDCPLCQAGAPININVGHGREYLAKIAQLNQ